MVRLGLFAAALSVLISASNSTSAVDAYVRKQMAAMRIPGMQVAIVQRGRVALVRSYGTASVELDVPVRDETVNALAIELTANTVSSRTGTSSSTLAVP